MKKGQLPTKTCLVCHRPFEWRKKWKDCWEEVIYCSERCRRNKNILSGKEMPEGRRGTT